MEADRQLLGFVGSRVFDDGFVELVLFENFSAVGAEEIADIAAEWIDASFGLHWIDVDEELVERGGQDRIVVRAFFTVKIREGQVDGFGGMQEKVFIWSWRRYFVNGKFLRLGLLDRFVVDFKGSFFGIEFAKDDSPFAVLAIQRWPSMVLGLAVWTASEACQAA